MPTATGESKADGDTGPDKKILLNPHPPKLTEDEIEARTRELEILPQIRWGGLLMTMVSIIMYIVDSCTDIKLAMNYYEGRFFTYFWLTVGFVVVPAIVVTIFSILLYILDSKNTEHPKPSTCQKILMWGFSILPLGPVLRDINVLIYARKSWNDMRRGDIQSQKKHYQAMLLEESDSAFLRLFERFLEAAPQATLQIYIWLHHICDHNPILDGPSLRVSVIVSLLSMASSLTTFNSTARLTAPGKQKITFRGRLFQFSWNFCMISSRVCSLAFFTAAYGLWILPVCAVHWLCMLAWLLYLGREEYSIGRLRTEDNSFTWRNCLYRILENIQTVSTIVVYAFVYVFAYFNTEDKPTKLKYFLYYGICMVENIIFTVLSLNILNQVEFAWAVGASYFLFGIGLIFMLCYFTWFHPSLRFSTVDGALRHVVSFKSNSQAVGDVVRNRLGSN